jgi:glucose/arabinose dehydrogenase
MTCSGYWPYTAGQTRLDARGEKILDLPAGGFGQNEDPRHAGARPDLVAKATVPDYPLGAHTASLGLVMSTGDAFAERYRHGAFIAQRGSWNRSRFAGCRVVFVPFSNGRPSGRMEDVLTGFIADEGPSEVYGRPVGLAMMRDGSPLAADDAGGTIWRVTRK